MSKVNLLVWVVVIVRSSGVCVALKKEMGVFSRCLAERVGGTQALEYAMTRILYACIVRLPPDL